MIDYKTGRFGSQKGVDESFQLSIYALACRDALGLGTPEKVTLYFTESATGMSTRRTDADLDIARADLLARTARIRSDDFAATPSADASGATMLGCAPAVLERLTCSDVWHRIPELRLETGAKWPDRRTMAHGTHASRLA